jgi:hypothetical protein
VLEADARAAYLAALVGRYRLLDLATLIPEAHDEHLPVLLSQVFVPQHVRATPPPVELPRELWRRLITAGDLGDDELPPDMDRELLARARQAHLDQPARPVLDMLTDPPRRLVALLGDPGAGKSSLLRYLTLTLASALTGGTWPRSWPDGRASCRSWSSCAATPTRAGATVAGPTEPYWTIWTTSSKKGLAFRAPSWTTTCAPMAGRW